MNLTPVIKTKDAVTLILPSSVCAAITPLAPVQHPCKSPTDSWASGAWTEAGGRCRRERGGRSRCRRRQKTRSRNTPSRWCRCSRSSVWPTDASPPMRWRNRGLGKREVSEHQLLCTMALWHSGSWTHLQMQRTCQQVWGGSLFLCLYQYMIPVNTESPVAWSRDWRWRWLLQKCCTLEWKREQSIGNCHHYVKNNKHQQSTVSYKSVIHRYKEASLWLGKCSFYNQ